MKNMIKTYSHSSQVRGPGRLSGSITGLELVSWVATTNARRKETSQLLVVVHVIVVLRQASACIYGAFTTKRGDTGRFQRQELRLASTSSWLSGLGETIGPHHRYEAAPARHIQERFNTDGDEHRAW